MAPVFAEEPPRPPPPPPAVGEGVAEDPGLKLICGCAPSPPLPPVGAGPPPPPVMMSGPFEFGSAGLEYGLSDADVTIVESGERVTNTVSVSGLSDGTTVAMFVTVSGGTLLWVYWYSCTNVDSEPQPQLRYVEPSDPERKLVVQYGQSAGLYESQILYLRPIEECRAYQYTVGAAIITTSPEYALLLCP